MSLHKYFFVALIIAISIASGVVAQSAPLTDPDNQHNFSSSATHGGPQAQPLATGGTDQICIFCHTPHSATPESTLWSRPDPNTSTFPLYGQQLVIKGDYPGSPAHATIIDIKRQDTGEIIDNFDVEAITEHFQEGMIDIEVQKYVGAMDDAAESKIEDRQLRERGLV